MAARIKSLIIAGRKVFFRFAPEMNGSWFIYGQRPVDFVAAWRRCITYWKTALGADSAKVAFIWAPNSGNGYPWAKDPNNPGENYSPDNSTIDGRQRISELDTNGNGIFDRDDDPYLPFYPGDEYVDWVGLSMYTYGYAYPWWTNDIPQHDKFEGMLQGIESKDIYQDSWGKKPFYTYFSSPQGIPGHSAGGKPFIVAETGATYHFAWVNKTWASLPKYGPTPNQTLTRAQVKNAWFESFLNPAFLAKYPKFKAVCTFEFVKHEEDTWRDFSNFGPAPLSDSFTSAANEAAAALREDFRQNMTSFLVFATGGGVMNGVILNLSALLLIAVLLL
ncbi:hypothetical protein BDR26DRAFT_872467 [Obelidium mucronatum]|nr:hypothetical protein BDR26DRAFT_872467 [Obelidium mucronatum]